MNRSTRAQERLSDWLSSMMGGPNPQPDPEHDPQRNPLYDWNGGTGEMNKMMMKGKWHQTKGALKERWGKLTDDDIQMFLGGGEQLVGKLQERYGYTQERAEREVSDFMDSVRDEWESMREDLPMQEATEKTMETVREHPWYVGMFFGGIALLVTGYILNRIFSIVTVEEVVTENADQ